jgi:hypothetical protein
MKCSRRNVTPKSWLLAPVVIAFFAIGAFAQVNMDLTGGGQGHVMAGVYTSPYTATINGMPTTIICDDFADDSFMSETWQANVSTVGSLGGTRFQEGFGGASQQQAYDAAAALSLQLLATSDATQMGYISYAIWDIFDDIDVQAWLAARSDDSIYLMAHSMAQTALNQSYTAGEYSNVSVYTAIAGTASGCPTNPCEANSPQEFLVVRAAEPPALALLGVYLSSLVGLILIFRRRVVASACSAE